MLKTLFRELSEEKDLEKKFFRYSALYTSLISILALVVNIVSELGIVLYILPFISIIYFFLCFYYSSFKEKYNFIKTSFFIGFITLLDFFYLFNGGLNSSIPFVLIIAFLMMSIALKRSLKNNINIFILFISNLLFMFYIEKTYPSFIKPYTSLESKEFDLIGSFCMVLVLIGVITNFFKSTYEKLINDIDIKNHELILSEKKAKEARNKAEEADNARREFLSTMNHEIRTPLNNIVSIINLIDTKEANNYKGFVNPLKYSSNSLMALVSNILDLNKIESNQLKLEKSNFNLKQVLESLLLIHKPQAQDKNNIINLNFSESDDYEVYGDVLRITQVLINLISNAIKFTDNGIIDVNIKIIEHNSKNNTDKIYFEIKDTGIGISEENIDYILDNFTRENNSINKKYLGSGLGLSITQKLLTLMDSKINIESKLGIGTKFYFEVEFKNIMKIIN